MASRAKIERSVGMLVNGEDELPGEAERPNLAIFVNTHASAARAEVNLAIMAGMNSPDLIVRQPFLLCQCFEIGIVVAAHSALGAKIKRPALALSDGPNQIVRQARLLIPGFKFPGFVQAHSAISAKMDRAGAILMNRKDPAGRKPARFVELVEFFSFVKNGAVAKRAEIQGTVLALTNSVYLILQLTVAVAQPGELAIFKNIH